MKKVLVVVDMQNDFVTGPLGSRQAMKIVPNIKKKIEHYLANNNSIIYTYDTHHEDYLQTQEGRSLPIPHCIEYTDGWRVVPELTQLALKNPTQIHTLTKHTFGSMDLVNTITDIVTEAEEYAVEFIGVCTDICIVTNALLLKTALPECDISVDASCCAGTSREKHLAALEVLESCQIKISNR